MVKKVPSKSKKNKREPKQRTQDNNLDLAIDLALWDNRCYPTDLFLTNALGHPATKLFEWSPTHPKRVDTGAWEGRKRLLSDEQKKAGRAYALLCHEISSEFTGEPSDLRSGYHFNSGFPILLPIVTLLRLIEINNILGKIQKESGHKISGRFKRLADAIRMKPSDLAQYDVLDKEEVWSLLEIPANKLSHANKILTRAIGSGKIDLSPSGIIEWAESKGYRVNEDFAKAVRKKNITNTKASAKSKTKVNRGRWAKDGENKKQARKVAKKLWKNENLTIASVIRHDEIQSIKNSMGKSYTKKTYRDWIKDLAPSHNSGRPSKKK